MSVTGADAEGGSDADWNGNGEHGRTVGELDGGVALRLTRRCRSAAVVLIVLGAGLLLVVLLRSWSTVSAVLALLAIAAVIPGGLLAVRAYRWSMIRTATFPESAGRPAVLGPPRPLSPVRTGAPLRRRLGASVVPIRAVDGEQPGGGAVVVHARADGLQLTDADQVSYFVIRGNVLASSGSAPAAHSERPITGRFVLFRPSDGAAFLATTRLSDTW